MVGSSDFWARNGRQECRRVILVPSSYREVTENCVIINQRLVAILPLPEERIS